MIRWSLRWGLALMTLFVGATYLLDRSALPPDRDHPRETATPERPSTSTAVADFGSELTIPAAPDGHFYVDALVNGTPVRFVIDTGATSIALSPEDAARVGLRPQSHEYTLRANTANGAVQLAPVSLREVRLGNLTAYDVEAAVTTAPMRISLLGMSFLRRLHSYEATRNELHLRW